MAQTPFYTKLEKRGLIHIEGADRRTFLQNIVTNDLDKMQAGKLLYSCLLSPQGKYLHDFFISEGEGFILLECEGGDRAQDLYKRLQMYKLRADVKITVEEDFTVYTIFSPSSQRRLGSMDTPGNNVKMDSSFRWNDGIIYEDPRHQELGFRTYQKPDLEEKPFAAWDHHRISLCIPDGSRDLVVNSSTLEEGHIDKLNGVSYEKGCYVGQELTARMHHRGLGKKHLYTVKLDALPQSAELRSQQDDIGIALVKDEFISA